MSSDQNIIRVNIDDIIRSKFQPRKVFDEESIKELALSIKTYGILNPLLVRKQNDKYEIIAGERRYRAAKLLGLKELPVIIKDISDADLAELALIENIQRNNLNPVEEAESYKEILSLSDITQDELSQKIGKSQSAISNKIRLLNLSTKVKDAMLNNKISEKHGRTLLKLTEEEQNQILEEIVNKKLTVKETEELINKKESKENIKSVLNSIDVDDKTSDTFNDLESEIKEKGENSMNNNMGIGSFFPQMDNSNQQMNSTLDNDTNNTITFNNTQMNTGIPIENTMPLNETTTIPLNTLNQEPAISTIPNTQFTGLSSQEQPQVLNTEVLPQQEINPTIPEVQEEKTLEEPVTVIPDTPLFTNPNIQQPVQQEAYTIPVNNSMPEQVLEKTSTEKIKELLSSLTDSKINYKEYSNDKENCIIITIEK